MLRRMQLSPECARVLGALVEKGLATPQQYPLTINALQSACNQTSNREPVVNYDESTVLAALHELKDQKLVRFVLPSHGRSVVRYRQVLDEALGLDAAQSAILAVLLLRGPQTVGELRIRTERMAEFDSLDEIQHQLDFLSSREQPLAQNAGRRTGQKEERWATPLVRRRHCPSTRTRPCTVEPAPPPAPAPVDVIDDLRSELAELRVEVADLRHEMQELRESLGG